LTVLKKDTNYTNFSLVFLCAFCVLRGFFSKLIFNHQSLFSEQVVTNGCCAMDCRLDGWYLAGVCFGMVNGCVGCYGRFLCHSRLFPATAKANSLAFGNSGRSRVWGSALPVGTAGH
jgi:hypothetical protein